MQDAQQTCQVCAIQHARYTCPRCRLHFCSTGCYRQHGEQCTEGFYRESAESDLKSRTATDEQRRHMQDILRRVHDDDDGGAALAEELGWQLPSRNVESSQDDDVSEGDVSEEVPLSTATLERLLAVAQLDPNEEDVDIRPEHLSQTELARFSKWSATEEAQKALSRWEPWWYLPAAAALRLTSHGTLPVQPLVQHQDSEMPCNENPAVPACSRTVAAEALSSLALLANAAKCDSRSGHEADLMANASTPSGQPVTVPPPPEHPLPPLRVANGRPPSPLVRWRLLQLLYGYALVMRLYNGDWATDPYAAALQLIASVPFLGDQAVVSAPQTGSEAALAAVMTAQAPGGAVAGDRQLANLILTDVASIASLGRASVICALADMHRLTTCATAAHGFVPSMAADCIEDSGIAAKAIARRLTQQPDQYMVPGHVEEPLPHLESAKTSAMRKKPARQASRTALAQLKVAARQLGSFFLPWANEQPPTTFQTVGSAAIHFHDNSHGESSSMHTAAR